MVCKKQLELSCLDSRFKVTFLVNKLLHVLLLTLFCFVKLNLSSNRTFCVSTVRECLQLDIIKLFSLNVLELRTNKFKH
jgi:hypothetical protein